MTRYVRYGDVWVSVGGSLSIGSLWPSLSDDGVTTASSSRPATTCTASATPHTKGAWTQVSASLAAGSYIMYIEPASNVGARGVNSSTLLDVGIGGSGSETVIIPNLAVGYSPSGSRYVAPITLASPARVAVRCQGAVSSQAVSAVYGFAPIDVGPAPATALVNIGANLATSRGVSLPAPPSDNTKSAWVELTSAASDDFDALMVCVQGDGDTAFASSGILIDVGIGGSGSETVIISNLSLSAASNELLNVQPTHMTRSVSIPTGTRIAARWQRASSTNSADVTLIGVPTDSFGGGF